MVPSLSRGGLNEASSSTLQALPSVQNTPALGANNIANQNGTKLRLKKFQSGAHTALGGAAESSKLKIAGAATLQRDREMNNKSDLSMNKKQ